MNSNIIFKTIVGTLAIGLLLVLVLFVHIYLVSKPNSEPHVNWQLARIDFEHPFDSLQSVELIRLMKAQNGVKQVAVNQEAGTLVFAYQSEQLSAADIFEDFNRGSSIKGQLFVPDAEALANGCPVIEKSSISYRLGTYFQNLIASFREP